MRTAHPPTQVIDLDGESPESTLAHVVKQVSRSEARILVELQGVPVAAIISAAELRRFSAFDREQDEQFSVIDRVRTVFVGIPDDEIEAETDRILARIRASTYTTDSDG